MIWRSTLVFLTSLAALTVPVESLRAQASPQLIAQSSAVDPNAAVDTGQAVPNLGTSPASAPLQSTISEQHTEKKKAIQQDLQRRGYYNGPIDGIFGPATEAAIQSLKQEGGQPLFDLEAAPGNAPASPGALSNSAQGAPASNLDASPDASGGPEGDTSSNTAAEETRIGEQVSPATGLDRPQSTTGGGATDINTADIVTTEEPPIDTPASPGLGRLLWPGLALIAALGSFGIGFILANRGKPGADGDTDESPWGSIPNEVPQGNLSALSTTFDPHVATNGGGRHEHDRGVVVPQPNSMVNNGSALTTDQSVSATTRLAKVDVMDELVSSLQVADPAKRRKAIWELGQRGNSSAVQHLVNGMVDADSKEKSLILAALSEIGIRSLKPLNRALAIALQDDNPDVRKNAIRDLTRVYDLVTQISQMLGHATEDEDPEVRRTAEWALGQLNRIREAPKLKSSLNTLEASHPGSELLPDGMENLKN